MYRTKKFFLLEYVKYRGFEELTQEDVEIKFIIGYFTTQEKLNMAKTLCLEYGLSARKLHVKEFDMQVGVNQKFVYVLNYTYSVKVDGIYTDYYSFFNPQISAKLCKEQKKQLLQESKYQRKPAKIYEDSPDGFFIDRIKFDFVSYIGFFDIEEKYLEAKH